MSDFDRVQELLMDNERPRRALRELLDLDERRPVDTTWWRKHWDALVVLQDRRGA